MSAEEANAVFFLIMLASAVGFALGFFVGKNAEREAVRDLERLQRFIGGDE